MSGKLSGMLAKTLDKHFSNIIKVINEKENYDNAADNNYDSSSETTENIDDIYIDDEQNNVSLYGIGVENEKFIINSNFDEESTPFTIMTCEGIKLYINEELCREDTKYNVTEADKIRTVSETIEGKRNINISISKDSMEAYVDISYTPEYIFKLKDMNFKSDLKLKATKEKNGFLPKYTVTEIMNELGRNGVKYGLIKENILRASLEESVKKLLVARGNHPIDDKPLEVKILFDIGDKTHFKSESMEKIDYKNVYSISSVECNEVLAEIIPERLGQNGKNIKGEIIKKKGAKSKPVKAGDGCKIENNKVIATRDGRPSSKNGILSVNNVYSVKNVDMKSGNINFLGDVQIDGSVGLGMAVKAGNSLIIKNDVDNASVVAGGEININGNVINSKIYTGQVDIEKKEYLDILNVYKREVEKLIEGVKKINDSSNSKKRICDIARILIESRHKDIPKLSLNIISRCIKLHDEVDNQLIDFLRCKVMGLNISNLKTMRDLEYLLELIEEEIDYYNDDMIIQSDIYVGYLQDSLVKSTGNIFVTGKGEYITNLIALKNIEFLNKDAVARGGVISAKGDVKLGTVGSIAGVSTRIEVPKDGIVTAEVAYSNTIFMFGKRSKVLEEDSRNFKAYMDKDGEIIFEKFKL
ncbi:DUF342 domain-containing protein [Clostridium butyricum]|uniref:DUF342 domain-containing protein n=1 Tax=Clostridium butyricum TaxID=1492 RepID=UPI0013D08C3A|nr:flagellar assembly protein A [Clostridium butyricum]MCQ2017533.1 FapA family protein [Clostridium butyricum]MCQ2021376.1 FapA family protein [Clostridium butyricum]NFB73161.1 DUF342 domain-containing protein [Clostridium butyricum]NFB91759.1 DUF342 domain-containing protein [Clostridium butyricum]UTY53261.1 DUF342 domain-containing protein [Clostridium butyricum]